MIICCCLLSAFSSPSVNKDISNKIGINIPKEVEINLKDTRSGFPGDGTVFAKIELEDKIAKKIITEIKSNNDWNKLHLFKYLNFLMYGGTDPDNGHIHGYRFAYEVGLPEIQNGYWKFVDISNEQTPLKGNEKWFLRKVHDFFLAIYDTDNDVLYYFHNDM